MRLFLIALRFLTRIGVGPPFHPRPEELPRSVRMYPLVGLVIGGILASAYLLLLGQAVLAPGFTGALLVALEAFLTGGLHLDGLMDAADGFFSGGDKERVLAVMKDSRVGAYGVLAAVLVLLMKSGLFASLFAPAQAMVVAAMPVLGRWVAALLAGLYPHAGEGGLGGAVIGRVDRRDLVASSGLCLVSLFAAASLALFSGEGWASFTRGLFLLALLWVLAAAAALLFARAVARRLGGITGDTVGAAVELSELLVLFAGALLTGLIPLAPGGRP
ncbi:MAG: adenosylcobinamide-GDP ribazoletransferase [Firmicutes bacterium]|nr:adenosylcobinamide-GDP ribazoletransferase [Bacillota bacterium]